MNDLAWDIAEWLMDCIVSFFELVQSFLFAWRMYDTITGSIAADYASRVSRKF